LKFSLKLFWLIKILGNKFIDTHLYGHKTLQFLALTRVMELRILWLSKIIQNDFSGKERPADWKYVADTRIIFVLRYLHFPLMWHTFLIETFVAKWARSLCLACLTILVQFKYVSLLILVFSKLYLPGLLFLLFFVLFLLSV